MAVRNKLNEKGGQTLHVLTPDSAVQDGQFVFTEDALPYQNGAWVASKDSSLTWDLSMLRGEWEAIMQKGDGTVDVQLDGTAYTGTVVPTPLGALVDTELSAVDHSGNAHDLTVTGATERGGVSDEVLHRYGRGYDLSAAGHKLANTDSAFQILGDMSATIVVDIDDFASDAYLFTIGNQSTATTNSADNVLARLVVESTGVVTYFHENGSGSSNALTSTLAIGATGLHTFTLSRNATLKKLIVSVDGVEFINASYANNPDGGSNTDLIIGNNETSGFGANAAFHEVRIWNSLVDQDTLDAIVDPNDLTYRYTQEGSEVGCWFMERPTKADAFKDHSGNGHDLIETGTVGLLFGPEQKFGVGVDGFTTSNYAGVANTAFELTGDMAATCVFTQKATPAGNQVLFASDRTGGDFGEYFMVQVQADGAIFYRHRSAGSAADNKTSATGVVTNGTHTLTLRRISNQVTIYLDGALVLDETYSVSAPTGGTTNFTIGVEQTVGTVASPASDFTIHQVAVWGASPPLQATLDSFLDATTQDNRRHAPDAPVAAYYFDYLDQTHDSAEHGFDLTGVGSPTQAWSGSKGFDAGAALNGTTQYFDVANDADLAHTGDMAVFMRIDRTATGVEDTLLDMANSADNIVDHHNLLFRITGDVLSMTTGYGTGFNGINSSNTVSAGQHTVIAIRDVGGSLQIIRLDGVQDSASLTGTPYTVNQRVRLGYQADSSPGGPFGGNFHDIRILNRVPTAEEIADYEAGDIDNLNPFGDEVAAWGFGTPSTAMIRKESTSDYTGSGHELTEVSGPFTRVHSTTPGFGFGQDLDGVADYWDVDGDADFATTGDFCTMVRFKNNTATWTTSEELFSIGVTGSSGSNDANFRLLFDAASDQLAMLVGSGVSNVAHYAGAVSASEHTLIATRDVANSLLKTKVDGAGETSTPCALVPTISTPTTRIGAQHVTGGGGLFLNGAIYDIIVLPRAPTDAEIANYEAGTLTASNAPIDALAAWGFEDNIEQSQEVGSFLDLSSIPRSTNTQEGSASLDTVVSGIDATANYDMTVTNAVERVGISDADSKRWGRVYDFNGTNARMNSTNGTLVEHHGPLTITGTFTADDLSNSPALIHSTRISVRDYYYVTLTSGGAIRSKDGTSANGLVTTGTLHTFVYIRDGSRAVFYLDGEKVMDVGYTPTTGTGGANSNSIAIGSHGNQSQDFFNGAIYEMRLWQRALDQELANEIIEPTNFRYHHVLEGSEDACWFMEKPTVSLKDWSENGHDLAMTGSVSGAWATSPKFDGGIGGFSGTDYVKRVDPAFGLTGDMSVACVTRMGNASSSEMIFDITNDPGADREYGAMYRLSTGEFVYRHGDTSAFTTFTVKQFNAGEYHLLLIRDDTAKTVTLYVDGVKEIDAVSYTGTDPTPSTGGTESLFIGINESNGSLITENDGSISMFAVWDKKVTPATAQSWLAPKERDYRRASADEIENPLALYYFTSLDNLTDTTEGGKDLVEVSGPFTDAMSKTAGFMSGRTLDGSADYYEFADNDLHLATQKTVMMRMKVNGLSTPGQYLYSDATTVSDSELGSPFLLKIDDAAADEIVFSVADGSTAVTTTSASGVAVGEHTIIAVMDKIGNDEIKLRVDGAETTTALTGVTPVLTGDRTRIGAWAGNTTVQPFNGAFYDIIVLDRAPTAQEITDYEAGTLRAMEPPTGSVAAWSFGDPITSFYEGTNRARGKSLTGVQVNGNPATFSVSFPDEQEIGQIVLRRTGDLA